jgi:hypothetical protein
VGSCRKNSASSIGRTASRYSCLMARDGQPNRGVQPTPSLPPLGTRGKRSRAGKSRGDAAPVGAASNASPVGGPTSQTGPRVSPGAGARGLSSSTRPALARCRRCRRRRPAPAERAVGSPPTRPAALGRSRALGMDVSITPSRKTGVERSTRTGRSAYCPCSRPLSACFAVSARATCRGIWGSCSACAPFIS